MAHIIGLTGGIASGKTTTSKILKDLGAVIVDADIIARKIVEKGKPALKEIEKYFGKEILLEGGELNRQKLGNIVFSDDRELNKLNEITHPYITKEIIDEINWHKKTCPNCVIILDAPLLIEVNLMHLVDEIWLVVIPEQMQINRLLSRECIKRQCISVDEAKRRINAQMRLEYKKRYADEIIDNSGDIACLKAQIKRLWGKITK